MNKVEGIAGIPAAKPRMSSTPRNTLLLAGGYFSLAFAVLQTSGIWWSARTVKYLGGPASLRATNHWLYAALCLAVAATVAAFGIYALSGAGAIRRLPLLRTALIAITAIYVLRGALILPQALAFHREPMLIPIHFVLLAAIALLVGLVHLAGLIQFFRQEG
jgi:hypothetical protein